MYTYICRDIYTVCCHKMKTQITDINHFAFFRILDILKENCETQHGDETEDIIKYADILNFATASFKFTRIVRDWDKNFYTRLAIHKLYVAPRRNITISLDAMYKTLNAETEEGRKHLVNIITSVVSNPSLRRLKLNNLDAFFYKEHSSFADEILKILQIKCNSKPIELILNIPGREIRNLHGFRNISKLILTASIEISDLEKFCLYNPKLSTLEVNQSHFSDHGKLAQIVPHCSNLKNFKFILDDNARDNDYVRLSRLNRLQKLKILLPEKNENYMEIDIESHEEEDMGMYSEEIGAVSTYTRSIPIFQLLKALHEKEKSTLRELCLGFDIDDEMVQIISKLNELRGLECGFYDPKSVRHFVQHPNLKRLSTLNKASIVTDDYAALLEKQCTVSNLDTKIIFNAKGNLSIFTEKVDILRLGNCESFLKLKNLKKIYVPDKMIKYEESTLDRFLALGVELWNLNPDSYSGQDYSTLLNDSDENT
ncbi:uncharacterized protein Dsimw501_GD12687, isoform A [Drosophila simulans]|uniref:Uncharacterized protein, isoform A n=3 Tax=Drosophila simulans TaxID=7240 RepID=A0A0J9RUE2_DROSI|nr:uncharacterized protein Dsimw501_GD12687, isoform A [Drosophila simulans]